MAISSSIRNINSILSLLLILIITPSSSSFSGTDIVTKELLNKLCSESTTFRDNFCFEWLSADPSTISITIHDLMKLTVKKTQTYGLNNQQMLSDYARGSVNDQRLKKAYESCVNSHGVAINELERTHELLKNSSFELAFYAASKALDYAYVCKDEFEGPSNEPSIVLERSENFIDMCNVAMDFTRLIN